MNRPPKWDSWLPEAERLPADAWEVRPDPDWTTDHPRIGVSRCRFGSPTYGWCGQPTVAVLFRGRRRNFPYAYCADHLYGRWIEDGRVVWWCIREGWHEKALDGIRGTLPDGTAVRLESVR